MNRLEELSEERKKLQKRLSEIRREEAEILELDGLDLQGKYIYSARDEIYLHVDCFKLTTGSTSGPFGEEKILVMEGEVLCCTGKFPDSCCYFHWEMEGRVKTQFTLGVRDFSERWKIIPEEKWKEAKEKALKILNKRLL